MTYSTFLRTVLKLDSLSCLGMAALLVPGAAMLADPFGIPAALLSQAGWALVPLGLFIGWLGFRGQGPAALVWLVILGNVGWAAASLLLAAGLPGIQPLGAAFVVGQGLVVLLLAILEWRGLGQSARVSA